jgi:hypothetical protein
MTFLCNHTTYIAIWYSNKNYYSKQ